MKFWLSLTLLVSSTGLLFAQVPRGKAEITLNQTTMTIDYGRPSLRGRDMLAEAPKGYVWRLGADQATTLTVNGRLIFGNMVVQKGTYTLFAERTSEDGWTLLVNSNTGQWGTEHDRSKDLMGVPLKWEKQAESTEELTIELQPEKGDSGILAIRWGKDALRQRFTLPPSK